MANFFVLKFENFRYLGNRGWCDTNFVCTLKFADPGNPILYKTGEYGKFSVKISKFSLPWQQGLV